MTKHITWKRAGIVYAIVAALTFAYEASDPENCWRRSTGELSCIRGAADGQMAGLVWPLYWLWDIATTLRGDDSYEAVQ